MKPTAQLPHYSTHAREFFLEAARLLPERLNVRGDFEEFLADYLQESVKFLLPDNGYLFDNHDYKPSMFELQRLPYAMCALEFEADDELYAVDSGLLQSRKRIALCFDPWQLPARQQERLAWLRGKDWADGFPERALAVMAVFDVPGGWAASVGMLVVDLAEDRPMTVKEAGNLSAMATAVGARLKSKGSRYGLPATFVTFPWRSALAGQDHEQAVENLYIDTIDETRVVYEFLAAVNCSNVGTSETAAPRMLNERRQKKGRTLFYPYKTLNLFPPGRRSSRDGGGTHDSPDVHLRRGHPRRLHEMHGGETVWINATTVNAGQGEMREQVYKVKA
ncbi:hypothetical protein AB4Y45_32090 [Paraburkholderia sp. EG287A]|uniref:hypothetical protein n=1 Tax=Paraburkholderia sp. EG287A TaxID=3237012 RepID=UPI0034D3599E